jgi:hypothetical protein
MKDTDPHTVKIAFSPMAQHYDGIKFPQVSHQKKQGKIRISEPSNRKIITEEVRKEDYPGKRKRKTNENKTKCTEQQQQQIKWMGTISSNLNVNNGVICEYIHSANHNLKPSIAIWFAVRLCNNNEKQEYSQQTKQNKNNCIVA